MAQKKNRDRLSLAIAALTIDRTRLARPVSLLLASLRRRHHMVAMVAVVTPPMMAMMAPVVMVVVTMMMMMVVAVSVHFGRHGRRNQQRSADNDRREDFQHSYSPGSTWG
jgi:hypothetical protein